MRIAEILYEMTMNQAMDVFRRHGVEPGGNLERAKKTLMMKHHPDRGGNLETAQEINAAYDVLSGKTKSAPGPSGPRNADYSGDSTYRGSSSRTETPPWAWAGYSGGAPPNSSISRNDFTDVNFLKKTMWELSGHSKQEFSLNSFDGHFFRGGTTVFGSPAIFNKMAEAMIIWETKGGNPYDCRAVFVSPRKSRELLLIYADGKFYGDNPIPMEHESFNMNPSNDQHFVRSLPGILDQLRDAAPAEPITPHQ